MAPTSTRQAWESCLRSTSLRQSFNRVLIIVVTNVFVWPVQHSDFYISGSLDGVNSMVTSLDFYNFPNSPKFIKILYMIFQKFFITYYLISTCPHIIHDALSFSTKKKRLIKKKKKPLQKSISFVLGNKFYTQKPVRKVFFTTGDLLKLLVIE